MQYPPGFSRTLCMWTSQIALPSSRNLDLLCQCWPWVWDLQEGARKAGCGEKERWRCTQYCKLVTALSSHICLFIPFGSIYSCLWNRKTQKLVCPFAKDQLAKSSQAVCAARVRPAQLSCALSQHLSMFPGSLISPGNRQCSKRFSKIQSGTCVTPSLEYCPLLQRSGT